MFVNISILNSSLYLYTSFIIFNTCDLNKGSHHMKMMATLCKTHGDWWTQTSIASSIRLYQHTWAHYWALTTALSCLIWASIGPLTIKNDLFFTNSQIRRLTLIHTDIWLNSSININYQHICELFLSPFHQKTISHKSTL